MLRPRRGTDKVVVVVGGGRSKKMTNKQCWRFSSDLKTISYNTPASYFLSFLPPPPPLDKESERKGPTLIRGENQQRKPSKHQHLHILLANGMSFIS